MNDTDTSLPELSELIEQRMALVRTLAESLASSSEALVGNDAEAIARGAAHQADLCRQWGLLEDKLRRQAGWYSWRSLPVASVRLPGGSRHLQAEWNSLAARIRYLTRVHWSLLRHLQRTLAVLNCVVDSCAPTYMPNALLRAEVQLMSRELARE
jgi:hypothetical protein